MATFTTTRPAPHERRRASTLGRGRALPRRTRDRRPRRRLPGRAGTNLRFFGGKTIEQLTFTHVYLGGKAAWSPDDVQNIDHALPGGDGDPHLNNVIAQYYADEKPTRPSSRPLPGGSRCRHTSTGTRSSASSPRSTRRTVSPASTSASSVFCFMLPPRRRARRRQLEGAPGRDDDDDEAEDNPALGEKDEAEDSKHGLGGYHGSVHAKHGSKTDTVYYAIGVYSEGHNGIVAFDAPWKSVCATFYHELNEARTDPTSRTRSAPATRPRRTSSSAGTRTRAARSATSRWKRPAPTSAR